MGRDPTGGGPTEYSIAGSLPDPTGNMGRTCAFLGTNTGIPVTFHEEMYNEPPRHKARNNNTKNIRIVHLELIFREQNVESTPKVVRESKVRLQGKSGDWKAKPTNKNSSAKSRARQTSGHVAFPNGLGPMFWQADKRIFFILHFFLLTP